MFMGVESNFAESINEHNWELGTEISYLNYEEPDVMEEEGMMYGIAGSYTYRDNWMLKGEGKWSYGQVDYSSPVSGTLDGLDDHMLEFRGLGGYGFSVSESTIITPYIGFGYRYLYNDLRGTTSTGARGYERESHYFYSPIGAEAIMSLKNGWSVGATAEFDIFWAGIQKSYLSQAIAGLNDIENDQKEGFGIRGSIKFQKEGDKVDFLVEPFVRYWDIEDSEETAITYSGTLIGYGYEPENNTIEYGVKFAAKF